MLAQRTSAACAGSVSGDKVKAASAAARAIIRALADLGLLKAPPAADPFAGLDKPRPKKKAENLDEALGV